MAEVYLAIQEETCQQVAIKVLSKRFIHDTSFGSRFLREAKIAAELQHEHILPVFEVRQKEDLYYIVMEYLPHGDFKQRLEQGIPLIEGLWVLKKILSALHYSVGKGFIHRDIKPENILFRTEDFPVLSDFGIARSTLSETRVTVTGAIMGTPQYMSPEQAQGMALDGRSDLYSLGVILFEMLSGHLPYTAESAISLGLRHITEPIPTLPKELAVFQPIINKALAKSPAERYQTGQEFLEALENLQIRLAKRGQLLNRICKAVRHTSTSSSAPSASSLAKTMINPTEPGAKNGELHPYRQVVILLFGLVVLVGGGMYLAFRNDPVTPTISSETIDHQTNALISKASKALQEERYSEPSGDNAQDYLSAVLTISPGNAEAVKLLETLTTHYLVAAEQFILQEELNSARSLLTLARKNQPFINDPKLIEQFEFMSFQLSQQETLKRQLEQTNSKIAQLTEQARRAWDERQLDAPPFENPIDLAQQILELDENNVFARQLLDAITDYIEEQIQLQLSTRQLSAAKSQLMAGTRVPLAADRLTELQKRIDNAIAEEQKRLVEAGKKEIASGEIQQAYDHYVELADLQPGNLATMILGESLKQALVEKIQRHIDANEISKAQEVLALARRFTQHPSHALGDPVELDVLQSEITASIYRIEQTNQQIAELLTQAEQAISQNRLVVPPQENALEYFLRTLELDPESSQASQGVVAVVNEILNEARNAVAANQPPENTQEIKRLAALAKQYRSRLGRFQGDIANLQRAEEIVQLQLEAEALRTAVSDDNPQLADLLHQILSIDKANTFAISQLKRSFETTLAKFNQSLANFEIAAAESQLLRLKTYEIQPVDIDGLELRLAEVIAQDRTIRQLANQIKQQLTATENRTAKPLTSLRESMDLLTQLQKTSELHPLNKTVQTTIADAHAEAIDQLLTTEGGDLNQAQAIAQQANTQRLTSNRLQRSLTLLQKRLDFEEQERKRVRNIGVF